MLISKTFDSSVICPAEQTCIVDEPVWDAMVAELQRLGARLLSEDEVAALSAAAFDDGAVQLQTVGQSCLNLGALAGFEAEIDDKVLLAPLPSRPRRADRASARGREADAGARARALAVVEHAIAAAEAITEHGGPRSHLRGLRRRTTTSSRRSRKRVRTGRILVNAPTAVGALGGVYNAMTPTFSLGCGTWGGSLTTDNINYRNLLNIKAVSRRQTPPQWFRVPSDTYFNPGALETLRTLHCEQALVVTDADTEARGVVDEVRRHLDAPVRVFADVEPEPSEATVRAGVEAVRSVRPDLIIAVGGGSALDAAKAIRLFHESPELSLAELTLPFLDARKRVAQFPEVEHSVRLVAVPTTSGTGSEVSPAAVLTAGGRKLTLVDYSLVPDMAIVDPRLTLTMPPALTADTGIDALTHALEAGVSIFASPYTDAFCMQALHLILDALPRACADGSDLAARTAMSNAATLAGLAFSNAFVGVCHSLAHAVGARFGIAHGRANGIFLPHVLRYNAALPRKFMPAPGYTTYVAPQKYAQMAWVHGLNGRSEEDRRTRLFARVDALLDEVGIPRSLAEAGVGEAEFEAALPELAEAAFMDPSLRTNPRMPLVAELVDLLRAGWSGR